MNEARKKVLKAICHYNGQRGTDKQIQKLDRSYAAFSTELIIERVCIPRSIKVN